MNKYEKYGITKTGAAPNERQMEWLKRERSIFFHFGMNTFTGKEWGDGTESPSIVNPSELCVESWIETIKNAGFKCAILTAKHHDGFCLWPSKYTEHSIKNSPYKNGQGDIVLEFTEACKKHGIKAGIYLSPWDRHEKTWGSEAYNDYYANQLYELMTNYGEIWECWWDGAGSTETTYDWERWVKIVRENQPNAVIFGSLGATPWVDIRWVGNEKGFAGVPCYATIDESSLIYEYTNELNHGKLGGERFIPAETDVSIRPGWFYHKDQDALVRTPYNLMELYLNSVGRGSGLLLNIPPNEKGLLAKSDVDAVLEFNKILTKTLNNNLFDGADLKVSSSVKENEDILSGGFYIPKEDDKCPTLEIKLPQKREINAIELCEAIEYGHKIVKISAKCKVDNAWQELFLSEVVGNKLICRFDTVLTDEIVIYIKEFLDTPVLTSLRAYFIEGEEKRESKKAKINPTITRTSPTIIDIDLGGIFEFDTINGENVGEVEYKLYLFNGTDYVLEKTGKTRGLFACKLDKVSSGAYRLRLEFSEAIQDNITFEIE